MDINEVIKRYNAAKAKAAAEKREADAMRKIILAYAGSRKTFETERYNVIIEETLSERLDTKSLYADFPDIKETYGKTTVSKSIEAAEKAAEKQTA